MSRVPLAAVAASLTLAAPAAAADFSGTALNIIPSGQYGGLPVPANADVQAKMYDALTPLGDQVTSGDLLADFKSEKFGAGDSCPCRTEAVPRPGVKITRDKFNVPHITGRNREDLDWAAGWVTEEDRALLLAQGRYAARFAALDAPGIDAFALVTGLKQVTVTKEADEIIEKEGTQALKDRGKEGEALLRDVDVYLQGINDRLKKEKSKQKSWTRADIYSVNALAGQIFGQGGGDEVRSAELLSGLRKRLGDAQGTTVWNDLTEHLDADTPTTMTKSFPYEAIAAPAPGSAIIDEGSPPFTAETRGHYASNFLMVSGKRSANGHPLFVAGPQIGYYYPGLTLELDLHAPGIDARGAAIPAGVGNILIGRGPDFAWSLTSAGSDTNDQFVETLCGGSTTKYKYKGKCKSMGTVDAGKIGGVGTVKFRTTVHGPVQGYATVNGKKVAVSFKRSSHGKDMLWQLMFKRMTDGKVHDVNSFYDAAAESAFTFNVAYADNKHIAAYSAGDLPIRDSRVDPRLPTKGTGEYEWKGLLKPDDHPHESDPSSGELLNWNNKPAPKFGSSDSEWGYGSIHRVQMLDANVATRQVHDLASLTGAMNKAATTDLPAFGTTLPAIAGVLATGPAPSPREQTMLDLLLAWRAGGSSLLDKDGDGKMDAGGAPAIMDAVYPRIADAVLSPVLGPQLPQLTALEGASNSTKSGFQRGRLAYVDKDLRQLLGEKFRSPFQTRFCGGGDINACRDALWQAFVAAGDELAAAQGTNDPTAWTSDATAAKISFAPGLLQTKIAYTNRPSGIQQVITFTGHRK